MYKICYSIHYNRREIVVKDIITALRLYSLLLRMSIYGDVYRSVRFYTLGASGESLTMLTDEETAYCEKDCEIMQAVGASGE